jgi:hypothetical protein
MSPVPHFCVEALRSLLGLKNRRPGYWREYHARNLEKRRAYLRQKARDYRAARQASITAEASNA